MPKIYASLGALSVLETALTHLLACPEVDYILPVIGPAHTALYAALDLPADPRLMPPITGGSSRAASSALALAQLAAQDVPPTVVLLHDAARPFVPAPLVHQLVTTLEHHQAVIPVLPAADTIKQISPTGAVEHTLPRAALVQAQTPQGFLFQPLLAAFQQAHLDPHLTDDAMVAEQAGMTVQTVPGDPNLFKITSAQDLERARQHANTGQWRWSSGYDAHQLTAGHGLRLGGITIPAAVTAVGHSDADVLLHALTDAILGLVAGGDLGMHFPSSDPQWKDADSAVFLHHALGLLSQNQGQLTALDATLICQQPQLTPHKPAMRDRLAELTGLAPEAISIKATTTDKLGHIGAGDGLACQVTLTAFFPAGS